MQETLISSFRAKNQWLLWLFWLSFFFVMLISAAMASLWGYNGFPGFLDPTGSGIISVAMIVGSIPFVIMAFFIAMIGSFALSYLSFSVLIFALAELVDVGRNFFFLARAYRFA